MTTALAPNTGLMASDEFEQLQRIARMLSVSAMFAAKGNTEEAIAATAVKIMAGQEMGIGPFAAVQNIHVIHGNPSVSAHMIASAIKAHPRYDYKIVSWSDEECKIQFYEDGKINGTPFRYGMDDATKAGLAGKDMWKKYRRAMLFSRCISAGYRGYCPDATGKARVYVYEEMGAEVDETGSVVTVHGQPVIDTDINAPAPLSAEKQARVDSLQKLAETKVVGEPKEESTDSEIVDGEFTEIESTDSESTDESTDAESTDDEGDHEIVIEPKDVKNPLNEVDFMSEDESTDYFSPYSELLMNEEYVIGKPLTGFILQFKELNSTSGRSMNKVGYEHLVDMLVSNDVVELDKAGAFFELLCQTPFPDSKIPGALVGNPLNKGFEDPDQLKLIKQVGELVGQIDIELE